MDILDAGRDLAEELMVDAGELHAPDVRVWDEGAGTYAHTPGVLRYSGKAKAQTTDTIGHDAEAGDRTTVSTRFEIHLPMSASTAAVGDMFTFTASATDPQLVGRRFRVASLVHKTWMTARRIAVEEVQS